MVILLNSKEILARSIFRTKIFLGHHLYFILYPEYQRINWFKLKVSKPFPWTSTYLLVCHLVKTHSGSVLMFSRSVMSDSLQPHGQHSPPGSCVHGDSPGKNIGVACHALIQGDFPNPGIKPRSPALQADSLPSEPPGKPCNYPKMFYLTSIYWKFAVSRKKDMQKWDQTDSSHL